MPINKMESLFSPVSTGEIHEVLRKKTVIASHLLKDSYPKYVTHSLDFRAGSESEIEIPNYEISYYINVNNVIIPYVSHNQSEGITQDVWFKIMNIPFFNYQKFKITPESQQRIKAARDDLILNNLPLAALAINAFPKDELNYITFSHHQEFQANEALSLIKESATQQLNTYGIVLNTSVINEKLM